MTSILQDTMFSLTPPPSELDEFEKGILLTTTCSPAPLSGVCYPSPTPSYRTPRASITSDAIFVPPEDMPFSETLHDAQDSSDMFFADPSDSSFYSLSSISSQDMANYQSSSAYTAFQQPQQWLPYAAFTHQPAMLAHPQPHLYPAFDPSVSQSLTNIIPPTPQDIAPAATFDFNTAPTLGSTHHLSASPSFSQLSHTSPHSSLSSLSRSCSPNPSLYQESLGVRARSNSSTGMRQQVRSNSTSSTTSLHAYGIPVSPPRDGSVPIDGPTAWRCAYPGCTSRATFTRGCDLRKHYNRHSKHLFCRVEGCPQSQAAALAKSAASAAHSPNGTPILTGGFSSKKDRARHEAKHNPGIKCEWHGPNGEDCGRMFSRMDNMKDHVRRIHKKGEQQVATRASNSRS